VGKKKSVSIINSVIDDIDTRTKRLQCGTVSEYKVDGLKSNFRYFARLIARNPEKDVDSEPTQSLTVRTERSDDDYDSDQNIENVVSGDFIIKEPNLVNNTWNINITG
jgi:hypothetical protein